MDGLKKVFEQLLGLDGRGRAAAVVAVLVVVGAVGAVAFLAQRADYALLYADLSDADAGRVVEKLRATLVPYRLSADGKSVSVPHDRVAELRLELAADGVVQGGPNGLELFERGPFGQTELAEQVTYTRALQGELARTISSLEPVEQAMVHLGRPRQSPFMQEQKAATASVVVRLRRGRSLSARQLSGIRELVAASVEGLEADRVSILDESGAALAGPGAAAGDEPGGSGGERSLEEHLVRKAQSLLDAALGQNKAIVRISVRLGREKVEERREKVDPKGVARSESTTTRTSREQNGERSTQAAGTAMNVPGTTNVGAGGRAREETEETTRTEYELGRSTSVTTREPGGVERLTIGLLLDEALDPKATKVEAIVKEAVGFDAKRGDTFQCTSVPFASSAALPEVAAAFDVASKRDQTLGLIDSGIAALAVLASAIVGFIAVKRAGAVRGDGLASSGAQAGMGASASAGMGARAPGAGHNPAAALLAAGTAVAQGSAVDDAERRKRLRTTAARTAESSPDVAGRVLDQWLGGGEQR